VLPLDPTADEIPMIAGAVASQLIELSYRSVGDSKVLNFQ
jgi:hypothetical protein